MDRSGGSLGGGVARVDVLEMLGEGDMGVEMVDKHVPDWTRYAL